MLFSVFISLNPGFPDITRDCKSKKAVIIGMSLAMLMVCIQFVLAQIGYIGLGAIEFTSLALSLGGAIFYICNVFTIFGQANTCPTCSFVVVQQAYALAKIPKKFVTFAQPIFACVMAFVLEYLADITIISTWLSVISAVYGPLIGLLWAEFYVVRKTHLSDAEVHPGFSKSGIITLIVGFLLCVYLTYFAPFASPVALVGIAFGFIVQIILRKGFKLS